MKKHIRKNCIYKGVSKRKLVNQVKTLAIELSALEACTKSACEGYQKDNEHLFKANKNLAQVIAQQEEEKSLLKKENEELCADIKAQKDYILRLEREREELRGYALEQELEISKYKSMPWWMQRLARA